MKLLLPLFAGLAISTAAMAQDAGGEVPPPPAPPPQQTEAVNAWREVAPENLLVLDTSRGRVLVEMTPEVAPNHVERIRRLAGQGFYDGQRFHRVIDWFMAQTGDPTGTGMGGSKLPDIPAEFSKTHFGRGTVGMARAQDPNSANSQFFIMFADGAFLNNQ